MIETIQEVLQFKQTFEHSPTLGQLTKALTEAIPEFGEVHKDTENPYYKSSYADLATLIKATRAALAKHGLTIFQLPSVNGKAAVTTMLSHTSNEWIRTTLELPATKPDAQGLGSAITYARRYAYQSILNIAGEEDDDGNAAVGKTQEDRKSSSTPISAVGPINPVQQRAFLSAAEKGGRTEKQVAEYLKASFGILAIEELPKVKFDQAIKWALNANPGSTEDWKNSVKARKQEKTLQIEIEDTDLVTNCVHHGPFNGSECPKC